MDDDEHDTGRDDGHGDEHDDAHDEFGEPAEASDADRVIGIAVYDDMSFDPASITVAPGEVVTSRVTNVGTIPHDFTLGDAVLQDVHDAEMAEMSAAEMGMHDEPNAFMLEPGETKEMTSHLTDPREVLYGCHTPGRYAAGMWRTILVEG